LPKAPILGTMLTIDLMSILKTVLKNKIVTF